MTRASEIRLMMEAALHSLQADGCVERGQIAETLRVLLAELDRVCAENRTLRNVGAVLSEDKDRMTAENACLRAAARPFVTLLYSAGDHASDTKIVTINTTAGHLRALAVAVGDEKGGVDG